MILIGIAKALGIFFAAFGDDFLGNQQALNWFWGFLTICLIIILVLSVVIIIGCAMTAFFCWLGESIDLHPMSCFFLTIAFIGWVGFIWNHFWDIIKPVVLIAIVIGCWFGLMCFCEWLYYRPHKHTYTIYSYGFNSLYHHKRSPKFKLDDDMVCNLICLGIVIFGAVATIIVGINFWEHIFFAIKVAAAMGGTIIVIAAIDTVCENVCCY